VGLQTWNRWARACAWGAVALYAAFLLAAPVLHHDLACHRTTLTHCPSCVAGASGPDMPSAPSAASSCLIDAGATPDVVVIVPAAAQVERASGRAPPSLSA